MSSDAVQIVQYLFNMIWKLFTSWTIPGTQATPAAWGIFMITAGIAIRFFRRITWESAPANEDMPGQNVNEHHLIPK